MTEQDRKIKKVGIDDFVTAKPRRSI